MNTAGAASTVTINLDLDVLGLTDLTVDNLELNGNTISTTDINGDLFITPNGTGGVVFPGDITVGYPSHVTSYDINGATITSAAIVVTEGVSDLGGFTSSRSGDAAAFGAHSIFLRSRNTQAAPAIVQDNDSIVRIVAAGFDGTDYAESAEIQIEIDGTPGSNDMPGRILFLTSPDGTQVPIEALRIDSSQVITLANALTVANGGTGATTLTDGGILLGSGTSAITATAQPTNGQLLIGSTGVDPVLATLTEGTNISITNAAGSITINANGGGQFVNVTLLDNTDSIYTVLSTDYYLSCDVSADVLVIDLPDAGNAGRVVIVKDSGGDAATNNITVTTVTGTDTIDGATSFVMNTNYEAANFIDNGTSWEVF